MSFIKSKMFWVGIAAAVVVLRLVFQFAPDAIEAPARKVLGV